MKNNKGSSNKGNSNKTGNSRPSQPFQDSFDRGIGKNQQIPIGDKVDANNTTTSTGPKGPLNKKS